MKKYIYLCGIMLLNLNIMAQIDLNDGNWELVFYDDFSGTGRGWDSLNFKELTSLGHPNAFWRCNNVVYWPCTVITSQYYRQIYQPSHCQFVNNTLRLVADYQGPNDLMCGVDYSLPPNIQTATCEGCEQPGKLFLSGMIQSLSDSLWFGYYEIRYRTPAHQDSHVCFWLYGNGPNTYEEIDIMEYSNFDREFDTLGGYSSGIWYNPDSTNYDLCNGKRAHNIGKTFHHLGHETNLRYYHTFGCEWMPNYIKWYRDGEVVAEYRQRDSIPQYKKLLMVTYAIGPFYHNSLPQWTDKDTLTIDYVFAYRLKTDCNTDVSIRTINDWQSYMPSVKQSIAIGSQNGLTVPQGSDKTLIATKTILIDQPFELQQGTQLTLKIQECPDNPIGETGNKHNNNYTL